MQYTYVGTFPVSAPALALGPEQPGGPQSSVIKPGDVITTTQPINNDDFTLV